MSDDNSLFEGDGGITPPEPDFSLIDTTKDSKTLCDEKIKHIRNSLAKTIKALRKNGQEIKRSANKIIDQYEKSRIDKLQALIKSAGIHIKVGNGSTALIDYSQLKNTLETSYNTNKQDFQSVIKILENLSNSGIETKNLKYKIEGIIQTHNQIKELYEVLEAFFINPPSREILIEESNVINLKKIVKEYEELNAKIDVNLISSKITDLEDEFKAYSDKQSEIINEAIKLREDYKSSIVALKEQFENFTKDQLTTLDNFQDKIKTRLNSTSQNYDGYISALSGQLEEQRKVFKDDIEEYKKIQKEHLDYIAKLRRAEKVSLFLNLVLATALGIVVAVAYFVLS